VDFQRRLGTLTEEAEAEAEAEKLERKRLALERVEHGQAVYDGVNQAVLVEPVRAKMVGCPEHEPVGPEEEQYGLWRGIEQVVH
jgi:hypothetical protein